MTVGFNGRAGAILGVEALRGGIGDLRGALTA